MARLAAVLLILIVASTPLVASSLRVEAVREACTVGLLLDEEVVTLSALLHFLAPFVPMDPGSVIALLLFLDRSMKESLVERVVTAARSLARYLSCAEPHLAHLLGNILGVERIVAGSKGDIFMNWWLCKPLLTHVAERLEQLGARCEGLGSRVEQALASVRGLGEGLASLSTVSAELLAGLADARTAIAGLQEAVGELRTAVEQFDPQLAERVAVLEDSLAQLGGQLSSVGDAVTSLQAQVGDLEGRLEQVGANLLAARMELEALAGRVSRVENQLAQVYGSLGELSGRVEQLGGELAALGGEVEALWGEVDELWTATVQILNSLSDLQSQVTALSARVTQVESQVSALWSNVSALWSEVDSLKNQVYRLSEVLYGFLGAVVPVHYQSLAQAVLSERRVALLRDDSLVNVTMQFTCFLTVAGKTLNVTGGSVNLNIWLKDNATLNWSAENGTITVEGGYVNANGTFTLLHVKNSMGVNVSISGFLKTCLIEGSRVTGLTVGPRARVFISGSIIHDIHANINLGHDGSFVVDSCLIFYSTLNITTHEWSQITIVGCKIDGGKTFTNVNGTSLKTAIVIYSPVTSRLGGVNIIGNVFAQEAHCAISATNVACLTIVGNNINARVGGFGIWLNNCDSAVITGNVILGHGGGVALRGTANNSVIVGNRITGTFSVTGTGNVIQDNVVTTS